MRSADPIVPRPKSGRPRLRRRARHRARRRDRRPRRDRRHRGRHVLREQPRAENGGERGRTRRRPTRRPRPASSSTVAHWDPAYNALAVDASITAARGLDRAGDLRQRHYLPAQPAISSSCAPSGTRRGATQTLASVLRLVTVDPPVSAALTTAADVGLSGTGRHRRRRRDSGGLDRLHACGRSGRHPDRRRRARERPPGRRRRAGHRAERLVDHGRCRSARRSTSCSRVATLSLPGGSGAGHFAAFTSVGPSATGVRRSAATVPIRTTGVSRCGAAATSLAVHGVRAGRVHRRQRQDRRPGPRSGHSSGPGRPVDHGGFTWVGLVIATGQVSIADGNGAVTGALLARGATS